MRPLGSKRSAIEPRSKPGLTKRCANTESAKRRRKPKRRVPEPNTKPSSTPGSPSNMPARPSSKRPSPATTSRPKPAVTSTRIEDGCELTRDGWVVRRDERGEIVETIGQRYVTANGFAYRLDERSGEILEVLGRTY